MAKQIRSNKSETKSVRKIVKRELESTLRLLDNGDHVLSDKSVHKIRTGLKKLRAYIRLLRDEIGSTAYKAENKCFRDAAKPFTEVRDAKALSETLENLPTNRRRRFNPEAIRELKGAVHKEHGQMRRQVLTNKKKLSKVEMHLRASKKRIKNWRLHSLGWSGIGSSLERSVKSARKAFNEAKDDPTPERLHEWRKQVKYLRYQIEILEPIWPIFLREIAEEMHRLTNYLGDGHDLDTLKHKLKPNSIPTTNKESFDDLQIFVEKKRESLRDKSLILGHRLFDEPSSDFTERIHEYWKLWRTQERSDMH